MDQEIIFNAAKAFRVDGELYKVEENTTGHINRTFFCYWNRHSNSDRITVLQSINTKVFPVPEIIDSNISLVNAHLKNSDFLARPSQKLLEFLPTFEGKTLFLENQAYWRMSKYIPNSLSLEKPRSSQEAEKIGALLGSFHLFTNDLDQSNLGIPIEDFQNVGNRILKFKQACQEDPLKRAEKIQPQIEKAMQQTDFVEKFLANFSQCPKRVTHADPKFNNFLIDEESAEPVAIIDIDTVMPGFAYYDLGDFIRGISLKDAEDAQFDKDRGANLEYALTAFKGYLFTARSVLSDLEIESLVDSGRLISVSLGLRFLTDFVLGDPYFRITREEQNLDRALTQLALAGDFELHREKFLEMI
ncbi:MAG: phosphotransferase [Bdellovibrionota bacterium]